MRVTVADSLGMCFGVRDAIEMALGSPHREDLTILGDLVHNPIVLEELSRAGIRQADSLEDRPVTGHVMITAHGASDRTIAAAEGQGYDVVEATCPLVRHAHRSLHRLVNAGYFPVVIGRANHVEVRGLVGDLDHYAVVLEPADLDQLVGRDRIGVVSQTTEPIDRVRRLVHQIRRRFPAAEVRFVDTVCQPTKERQDAARRLAAQVDLMIVIGGRMSNNTHQLSQTCESMGVVTHEVEDAAGLRAEWFEGVGHVGVTAGTSTPNSTIVEVVATIRNLGGQMEEVAFEDAPLALTGS